MLQHIDAVVWMGSADNKNLPEAFESVDKGEYHSKEHTVPHLWRRDIAELL